jgi:hypothetical protein
VALQVVFLAPESISNIITLNSLTETYKLKWVLKTVNLSYDKLSYLCIYICLCDLFKVKVSDPKRPASSNTDGTF